MRTDPLTYTYFPTPIGDLLIAGSDSALHFVSFPTGNKAFQPKAEWLRDDVAFTEVRRQLTAYFAGDLKHFDLPLHLAGTEFQRRVWTTLGQIPYGETRTYGWLARAVGSPAASRAVGAANGANPIPIILPCHRVIGSTGALAGFGGGIETKRFLLQLEGVKTGENKAERQLSLL
jgi:methylated-DNA-[protein]-cysteine S-methyltransferase